MVIFLISAMIRLVTDSWESHDPFRLYRHPGNPYPSREAKVLSDCTESVKAWDDSVVMLEKAQLWIKCCVVSVDVATQLLYCLTQKLYSVAVSTSCGKAREVDEASANLRVIDRKGMNLVSAASSMEQFRDIFRKHGY